MPEKHHPKKRLSTPAILSPEPFKARPKAVHIVALPKEIRAGLSILPKSDRPNPTSIELANLAANLGPPFSSEHALVLVWKCAVTQYQASEAIRAIEEKDTAQHQESRAQLVEHFGFDPYDYPNGIPHEAFLELIMPRVPDKRINGKRIRTREDDRVGVAPRK